MSLYTEHRDQNTWKPSEQLENSPLLSNYLVHHIHYDSLVKILPVIWSIMKYWCSNLPLVDLKLFNSTRRRLSSKYMYVNVLQM